MDKQKNILFLSLGSEPAVFYTTMKSFVRDLPDVEFSKVVVFCNSNLKKGELKTKLENAISNSDYPRSKIKKLFGNNDDLTSKEHNLDFFNLVFKSLEKAKKDNFNIYVNIAGGRKQMSALLLTAAYISGVERVFHTFFEKGENEKDIKFGLIEIPHLHLDKLLERIVTEIDREGRFQGSIASLVEQLQTEQAFEVLNKYLTDQGRYRKLKEEFLKNISKYNAMMQATEMIIRNILKDKLMFQPRFERRIKDFESFYQKILRKESNEGVIVNPFQRFTDIVGLRAVFYNTSDLERAVNLVKDSGDFVNFKGGKKVIGDDKSESLGYRAVHLDVKLEPRRRCQLLEYQNLKDVPCEVQFTTIFAHAWSKVHHALSYKDSRNIPLSEDKRIALDIAFKEAAKNLKSIEEVITKLSNDFYPKTY